MSSIFFFYFDNLIVNEREGLHPKYHETSEDANQLSYKTRNLVSTFLRVWLSSSTFSTAYFLLF